MILSECPYCESSLFDEWQRGRKLQQRCMNADCTWLGELRIPEQQEIKTTRSLSVVHTGGFTYEVYDKYGHILVSSQSYGSAEEAEKELRREIDWGRESGIAGPYTGILWPARVTVEGTVIK